MQDNKQEHCSEMNGMLKYMNMSQEVTNAKLINPISEIQRQKTTFNSTPVKITKSVKDLPLNIKQNLRIKQNYTPTKHV